VYSNNEGAVPTASITTQRETITMAIVKHKEIFGMIQTSDAGLRKQELYPVDMDSADQANMDTSSFAGFRIWYGVTAAGEVFEFFKAGRIAKRDLQKAKELGVTDMVCSWAFAPSTFEVRGTLVKIAKCFEHKGTATQERLDRYARAMR
jgi:hypothetical protein